jgi:hypothetical protein
VSDFGDFMSGTVGGAEAGTAIAPGIGTAIGAAAGGILSLFGDSAEQKRKKRLDDLLAANRAIKIDTENRGFLRLGGQVQRNMSAARQAATRRAAAMGRMGAVEAFAAPAESRAQEAGGQAISQYSESLDRMFAQADLQAQAEYAGSPITPSTGETVGALGSGIGRFMQNKNYIDMLKNFGMNKPATTTPSKSIMQYQWLG